MQSYAKNSTIYLLYNDLDFSQFCESHSKLFQKPNIHGGNHPSHNLLTRIMH